WLGFLEDAATQQPVNPLFCHYVYFPAKEVFKVLNKAYWKPRTGMLCGVHQQIDIALFVRLMTCHRTKHTYIARTVFDRKLQNRLAFFLQELVKVHVQKSPS